MRGYEGMPGKPGLEGSKGDKGSIGFTGKTVPPGSSYICYCTHMHVGMSPYGGLSVQVSRVDLVKRVLQGFQGLQETLVVMVGLVRNKSLHVIHTSYFMDMFTLVQSKEL